MQHGLLTVEQGMAIPDIEIEGRIFNIQKYSVHDGPGIRTIVFLKGCPLRCQWCSNPESQSFAPELGYNANKCLGCSRCIAGCPVQALSRPEDGSVRIDRSLCLAECDVCVVGCRAKALVMYGELKTVKEVLYVVERDSQFYARSGGGLTVSGGEPFAQPEFLMALLRESRKRRIHTAVESCGLAPESVVLEACRYVNYLLYDIKCMDSDIHKRVTGVPNNLILCNLQRIRAEYPKLPILVRTPVVPGVNDTREAIGAIVDFVRSLPDVKYELLPYHRMGRQKYTFLGREYISRAESVDPALMEQLIPISVQGKTNPKRAEE